MQLSVFTRYAIRSLAANRTRTVADVRHILSKNGGNLGAEGSVSFMFKHCGQFLFAPGTATEDDVMAVALDAGADDVIVDDEGGIEVTCDPQAFEAVNEAFEKSRHEARNG